MSSRFEYECLTTATLRTTVRHGPSSNAEGGAWPFAYSRADRLCSGIR